MTDDVYTSVPWCARRVYTSYHPRMPANTSDETTEIGIRELRAALSDVVNETAVRGRITWVTSRGRRLAAIVPVPDAEGIVEARKKSGDTPAE